MNIETVNELITSLESAGELSIKERKYLEALKEFRLCSVSLDVAVKVANDFDRVIMESRKITGCPAGVDLQDHLRQLAAENVGLNEQVLALAADNSALINSSVCALQDGRPPHGFYASEWFIAKLKTGEYAALKALPEEYSYDYRTNDGTYYTKDWVVGWMQTPDTEYRPNVKTPATDRIYAGIKADGVEEWVSSRGGRWNGTTEEALKYAAQLRKGASE